MDALVVGSVCRTRDVVTTGRTRPGADPLGHHRYPPPTLVLRAVVVSAQALQVAGNRLAVRPAHHVVDVVESRRPGAARESAVLVPGHHESLRSGTRAVGEVRGLHGHAGLGVDESSCQVGAKRLAQLRQHGSGYDAEALDENVADARTVRGRVGDRSPASRAPRWSFDARFVALPMLGSRCAEVDFNALLKTSTGGLIGGGAEGARRAFDDGHGRCVQPSQLVETFADAPTE